MLKSLAISNLAVIAETNIEFESGLNILTGETGAGKSIIIDAINLVLGSRASKEMIRSGEAKARVEALFYVDKAITDEVKELGIECEEELLIVREFNQEGKNIIRINGSLSTLSMLKNLGVKLINIHGQHDNHMLLNPDMHLRILDDFGNLEKEREEYNSCFSELKELREKLKSMKKGEYEELLEERKIMTNMQKITESAEKAYNAISGGSNGMSAMEFLTKAVKETESISQYSEILSGINGNLNRIYYELEDLSGELSAFLSDTEFDEETINAVEKRIDELNDIRRRFGSDYESVNEYYLNAKEELSSLVNNEEITDKLEKELSKLKEELKKKGEKLSLSRKKTAKELEKIIVKELSELNMPSAKFETAFEMTDKYYKDGIDKAEFLLSVNPGISPGKLSKIASGGELSGSIMSQL